MTGRSCGGPFSISRSKAFRSTFSEMRSPSRSSCASRAAAKAALPGVQSRPRSPATKRRKLRRKASDSITPCQEVPKAAGAQPRKVGDGCFGAGDYREVGGEYLCWRGREGDEDAGLVGEGVEVGEVADPAQPNDSDPQDVPPERRLRFPLRVEGERVLAVEPEPRHVRQRPEKR